MLTAHRRRHRPLALLPPLPQGLCTFTAVPVDAEGRVAVADVLAAVTPATVLVTLQHSNNEVGALQPVAEVAAALRAAAPGVLLHSDAAQSLGKVDVGVQQLGVDMLTLVGHKVRCSSQWPGVQLCTPAAVRRAC